MNKAKVRSLSNERVWTPRYSRSIVFSVYSRYVQRKSKWTRDSYCCQHVSCRSQVTWSVLRAFKSPNVNVRWIENEHHFYSRRQGNDDALPYGQQRTRLSIELVSLFLSHKLNLLTQFECWKSAWFSATLDRHCCTSNFTRRRMICAIYVGFATIIVTWGENSPPCLIQWAEQKMSV